MKLRTTRRPPVPELDFAARRRAPGWMGWLALVLGCAVAIFVVQQFGQTEADVETLRDANRRAARAAEQARVLARREQDDAGLRARLEVARKLSARMARDWQPLFADLEARGNDIALLSVEPDAARGVLRVTGEAKDLNALFAYAESFMDAQATGAPRIETFELKQRDGIQIVAFSLRLQWRGA